MEKAGEKVAAIKAMVHIRSGVVDGSLKIRVLFLYSIFHGNKFRGIRSGVKEQPEETQVKKMSCPGIPIT